MAAQTAAKDPRLNSNWGTIVEPPFPLGAQKLEGGQVQELTERLHTTETKVCQFLFCFRCQQQGS